MNGLRACESCRKAGKALTEAGIALRIRDLREDPPSAGEIAAWHAALGSALLNTRSTTWRSLPEEARAGDPLALMRAHPALIKRPLFETGDALHLGWTPATRAALGL
ncbi:arsenate reductase family protein [Jannaschia formosa]|uniref:arsenate reductase family protein n=1 Tax=Jannaschia formosa TaxID=2259592 RepID=UPI001FD8295A|nr:ArsC/Spx/MgsR family protein [Jannaschia formosa]